MHKLMKYMFYYTRCSFKDFQFTRKFVTKSFWFICL